MSKFQGGIENSVAWFESVGITGFLAYIVAGIEIVGGIAMIIGLGTRVFAILFGVIMINAIFFVKFSAGFLNGYSYDLLLLFISVHMLLNGSKLYSLDHYLFGEKDEKYSNASVN